MIISSKLRSEKKFAETVVDGCCEGGAGDRRLMAKQDLFTGTFLALQTGTAA